jgi:hypothetical protein
MLEREKYHEALREEALLENDDDEHLEVIDNNDGEEGEEKANPVVDSPMSDVPPSSTAAGKRRRPPIDPFAGLCGSPWLTFPHLRRLFFTQVMVMVKILAPRQRPLRQVLHQGHRDLARKIEEFIKRTSVRRPRVVPIHLQA